MQNSTTPSTVSLYLTFCPVPSMATQHRLSNRMQVLPPFVLSHSPWFSAGLILMRCLMRLRAGLLRVYGPELAEVALLATRQELQGNGLAHILQQAAESALLALGVLLVAMPALPQQLGGSAQQQPAACGPQDATAPATAAEAADLDCTGEARGQQCLAVYGAQRATAPEPLQRLLSWKLNAVWVVLMYWWARLHLSCLLACDSRRDTAGCTSGWCNMQPSLCCLRQCNIACCLH